MNALAPEPAGPLRPTPHRFSVDDLFAMVRAGVIPEGGRQELVGGEVIDMAADGPRNLAFSSALLFWLADHLDRRRYRAFPNATLVLSPFDAPSPDWWIAPVGPAIADLRGPDVLLAIEQSDTTLAHDLGRKARLYAEHGIRDYWVIDLEALIIHVHREPTAEGYGEVRRIAADQAAEALLIPALALRLSDLSDLGSM